MFVDLGRQNVKLKKELVSWMVKTEETDQDFFAGPFREDTASSGLVEPGTGVAFNMRSTHQQFIRIAISVVLSLAYQEFIHRLSIYSSAHRQQSDRPMSLVDTILENTM